MACAILAFLAKLCFDLWIPVKLHEVFRIISIDFNWSINEIANNLDLETLINLRKIFYNLTHGIGATVRHFGALQSTGKWYFKRIACNVYDLVFVWKIICPLTSPNWLQKGPKIKRFVLNNKVKSILCTKNVSVQWYLLKNVSYLTFILLLW